MSLILKSSFPEIHIDCIWCIKYHPFKQLFASSGSDALILIWEYSKEKSDYIKKQTLEKVHKSTIRYLDWDYSGEYLSAASFDFNISIYKMTNLNTLTCLTVLESNDSEIKSVSWSKSGNFIASCTRKGKIWIWEKEIDEFESEDFSCKTILNGDNGDIKMVKYSPYDDALFSCGFSESIKIWELNNTQDDYILINTIKGHEGTIWHIEFNKKGNIFFTCSDDKSLIMWGIGDKLGKDNNNNEEMNEVIDYKNIIKLAKIDNLHLRPIYSCILSFDEKYIFTCSNDGNIGIVEIINNNEDKNIEMKLIKMIKDAHEQLNVNCLCVNKNEIISGGDDCNIKIWTFKEK